MSILSQRVCKFSESVKKDKWIMLDAMFFGRAVIENKLLYNVKFKSRFGLWILIVICYGEGLRDGF